MMKILGVTLVGFIVGAFVGGVLFDSGPGVDVVPLLFGAAGGGCALLVGMRVFRRRSE